MPSRRSATRSRRLNEAPTIAIQIRENRDSAIRLLPRLFGEGQALRTIVGLVAREIIRFEEEKNPPATLLANSGALSVIGRPCEEKRTAAAARRHDYSTFIGGNLPILRH